MLVFRILCWALLLPRAAEAAFGPCGFAQFVDYFKFGFCDRGEDHLRYAVAGLYDKVLFAEIYQDFIDNRNDKNFARVLVANFLLEGLYFYNGFNFFYNLAARSLMIGTADEIKYINRDELTHCVIFANIIKEIRQERHDFFNDDEIYEMFAKATEQEINWSNHIIGNRVMGITPETIEQYTKFMANKRLKEIGMQPLFEGFDSNPYKQLENIADTNGAGSVKGNFFEANVSSYNQSTAIEGWEEI